jgi:hypothetical protein
MTKESAQQMRWPALGKRYRDKMIHPSDGEAWKSFVAKYPVKAGNPRSVAVAISTDGFNPYGMSAAIYMGRSHMGRRYCISQPNITHTYTF